MKSPSIRQKKTLANMVENGGNVSKAMSDAGFSDAYSKNPQKLTSSETFQEFAARILSDEKLLKVADEGLSSMKVITSPTEPDRTFEDYAVRQRYLETALKVRGLIIDRKDIQSGGKPIPILGGATIEEVTK